MVRCHPRRICSGRVVLRKAMDTGVGVGAEAEAGVVEGDGAAAEVEAEVAEAVMEADAGVDIERFSRLGRRKFGPDDPCKRLEPMSLEHVLTSIHNSLNI